MLIRSLWFIATNRTGKVALMVAPERFHTKVGCVTVHLSCNLGLRPPTAWDY
jgi:hypothetical protein